MIFRATLAALAASACCAATAVAAPTDITEFPAGSKAMYIKPSPVDGTLWITRQGVGVQQFSTAGAPLASALNKPAAADLDVDTDGSVFWAANTDATNEVTAGWARRSPGGTVTTEASIQAQDAYALLLPSPGGTPIFTGSFPTSTADCVWVNKSCRSAGPSTPGTPRLTGLAFDGTGRLWSVSPEGNTVIRVVQAGNAPPDLSVTLTAGTAPGRIVRGPDGNLWVAGFGNSFTPSANLQNRIVRITPQGEQLSFLLPPGRGANDITLGPDGALWFTEHLGNGIGRITTDGQYRSFPVPSGARPYGITTGPDKNIWFTEFEAGRIGKLQVGDDVGGGTPLKAVKDTTKPRLSSIGLSRTTFRAARSGASVSQKKKRRKVATGTKVSFRLSEAGKVRFTIQRKARGRRSGRRCVAPKRSNRGKKRCTRYVAVRGSFTVNGTAGRNSFTFRGRVGGRSLRSGSYRLTAKATDPAKNVSAPRRKAFRVVR